MDIDIKTVKKVFFIGIGGIGISAIARMMLLERKEVFGSDISQNEITIELQKLGAKISIGQGIELIPKDVDLIVYSIAIPKYDSEFFKKLQNTGIKIKSYPEMLGMVTKDKYTIAISGTHGKTTTTAMIAKIFMDAKRDPSVIVGSLLKDTKSNLIVGNSNFFIVEACEYEKSFLCILPKILVITNIDRDHLDYFRDLKDIQHAFEELILQTENLIVFNGQDKNSRTLIDELKNKNLKIGILDYSKYFEKVPKLSVPGVHNRMNAAAALAVADVLNIKEDVAHKSIAEFSGTWRRLEKKGETALGTIIYDDYAHHPTEIRASLQALRELYPKDKKKITVIFQPHLYSRTKALFDEFSKSFILADQVYLLPIYFAREAKDESVSSDILAVAIKKEGVKVESFTDFATAENRVLALNLGKDDILVTMGAGEAYKVAEIFKIT